MPKERELNLIDPDDVEEVLEQRHRDAMLDLILAWASLDGALGMMLARVLRIPTTQAAELVERMPASARFAEMRKMMLQSNIGKEAAHSLKKHKKAYEKLTPIRNMIAHSHCAGIWKKHPDYVVFLTFKKVGEDALAVDGLSVHGILQATAWAKAMRRVAYDISQVPYEDAGN